MKTIKLFVAAAIVALAASCSSKPADAPAAEAPSEEAAPAPETAPADSTAAAPADSAAAQ